MNRNKLASKIALSILRGDIDPMKVSSIEKKLGIKLNLSEEQLAWSALVFANRQECANIYKV